VRIGIVGATGVVGRELLSIVADSRLGIAELRLSASSRSVGKKVITPWGELVLKELNQLFFEELDLCFFCVSSTISRRWVPVATTQGVICIDNSSAFRMEPNVPIIVPEVNADLLKNGPKIIANPNCCVAQLVPVLAAINREFQLEEVWVSTYQAVSGAGQNEQKQLEDEATSYPTSDRHKYLFNVLAGIGDEDGRGHCQEEYKIIHETRKILVCPHLPMAVNTVRVPVFRGHSLAVSFRTHRSADVQTIQGCLALAENIVLASGDELLPTSVAGTDQVYVGRVRENTWHKDQSFSLWIVADNLRKGAAGNAAKILERWAGQ